MNQNEVLEGLLPRMSCRFRRSVIGKWGLVGGRVRKAGWWCGGGLSLLAPSGIAPALSETRRSGSTRALCRPPVQLSGERVRARRQVAFFCRLTVGEGLLPREGGDETGGKNVQKCSVGEVQILCRPSRYPFVDEFPLACPWLVFHAVDPTLSIPQVRLNGH